MFLLFQVQTLKLISRQDFKGEPNEKKKKYVIYYYHYLAELAD